MYFIKYQPLKEKLRTRSLSDREALPYFIIYVVGVALSGAFPMESEYKLWDWISVSLSVLLTIGGVFYAYRENGGDAGYDLILKYIVIGWIVSIRFFLIIFIPLVLFITLDETIGLVSWDATESNWDVIQPYFISVIFITVAIYYQRIGMHIRDTRSDTNETVAEVDSLSRR
jgi:hypothetical protein